MSDERDGRIPITITTQPISTSQAEIQEELHKQIERRQLDPAKAVWLARKNLPWRDWLIVDFLRYWYLVGVLALEAFLGLELVRSLGISDPLGGLFVLAVMAAAAYLAVRGYLYFWPDGPLTRLDTRRSARRRARKRRFE